MIINKDKVFSILRFFRYLFKDVLESRDILDKDLSSLLPTKNMIYPCDVIDLGEILKEEKIKGEENVVLFSIKFAEKYLKRYPVFLLINTDKLNNEEWDSKCVMGALHISEVNKLNIENAIVRITINEPLSKKVIENIFKIIGDCGNKIECGFSNSIPGISSPNLKLTSDKIEIKSWYKKEKLKRIFKG